MLTTEGLEYKYPKGEGFCFPDLHCAAKEQLLVLGASGAGKSTFLHLVGGLITPQKGRISLDETDMSSLSAGALDKFRGKNIGIIFQKNHFIDALTVLENLMIAQQFAGQKLDRKKCLQLLDRLNIVDKASSKLQQLSEGQKQRVAIARSLVNTPKLILADEPTSALDDDNCKEVIRLLDEQAQDAGAALVIVTHDGRLKEIIANQITLRK